MLIRTDLTGLVRCWPLWLLARFSRDSIVQLSLSPTSLALVVDRHWLVSLTAFWRGLPKLLHSRHIAKSAQPQSYSR